ncbi:MAG: molybdenum cofactor guanylyltransferase [Acidobacteriota bacterium]
MIGPIDNDNQFIEGFVLAGGASSRMGQNKAHMCVGGKRLFERAVAALSPICHGPVAVVGRTSADLDFQTGLDVAPVPDLLEIRGTKLPQAPIVGLYTALTYGKMPWIAILACDLPFVTGDLMIKLAVYRSDEIDAIVPIQPDANPQPLCAIYRRDKCLPVVKDMVEKGDLKMRRVVSSFNSHFVGFDKIAHLRDSANFFFNVNNPERHESACKMAGD